MTFAFKQVTVSGGNEGIEGTSAVLNEVTDLLVNGAGWILEDDRRDQAGTTNTATTHKVVLRSDGGESGNSPNWYLTLISGTSSAAGIDAVSYQIATAYDIGTHEVPASGIKNVDTTTVSTLNEFQTDSDGYNVLFVAADKDGICVVNNIRGDEWGIMIVGKAQGFLDETFEPYSIYAKPAAAISSVAGSSVLGIVSNPPENTNSGATSEFVVYTTLNATNEPRQNLVDGQQEPLFTAVPIFWAIRNTSPSQRGVIGAVRHLLFGASDLTGVPLIGKVRDPKTGQEFICFSSGSGSIYLRAS